MMKYALIPLLAVFGFTGCAGPAATVRYEPKTSATVRLPAGELPRLLIEEVSDQAGRGEMNGPVGVFKGDPGVSWAEVVRDAMPLELTRLGWPLAQSRGLAGARLKVTVMKASAKWNAGFGVRVDGNVRMLLTMKEPSGREIWESELVGAGAGTAGGGGAPANGIRQAWAAALNEAMSRLGPLLDAERPWLLLGKAPAEAAQIAAKAVTAAPALVRSDLDELPAARPESKRRHAVVVGVERYRENLPRADFAAGDARLAAEYFKRVLGVPEQNLALLVDERAAKSDFEKYFERWLPNRVEPGDEVFVYFSGHGSPNPAKGDAYLVPYDGDPTYIDQTGYPLKRLYDQLAKLPAKSVLVAMDSCFSGAGGRSVLAKGARPLVSVAVVDALPAKITVLAAAAGDQISNGYQEKGHGLFTYFLLKGLKERGANMKGVFEYLKPEVARTARREYNADQEPQWRQGK